MSKFNCKEFNEITSAAWKQKIQVDLKGLDYNDTLLWQTNEGFSVKPFYHLDENIPASNVKSNPWRAGQLIDVKDVLKANTKAIDAVEKGAESLVFEIRESIVLSDLLANIDTKSIEIQFLLHFLDDKFIQEILNLEIPKCYVNVDPIGHLSKTGNWYFNLKKG